ncbi:MAG: SGNH/GDSL hydrolase family protein [Nocardioidaceae bacterium]|nr:SGNH/GDSL hydrolase family protein [Nocardioidaceae bacterium]
MGTEYFRFVALGDSQTEGLNDGTDEAGHRGWADRFAEMLARTTSPELHYANLAVRGCRARHVREVQLPAALALRPDLATVVVGMNDLLRHDFDADAVVEDVEATVAGLRATGCRVATMTFPDVAMVLPVLRWLRPKQAALNLRLVEVASRYDVDVLDLFPLSISAERGMWSHDRIHGSAVGHGRIAEGMAHLFGLPGADPDWASTIATPRSLLRTIRDDGHWVATFLVPFLVKQLRGQPYAAAVAKRPGLLPVTHDGRPTLLGGAAVEA